MKRTLEKELYTWKTQKRRLPLLIRGARQVGKSYLVEQFGNAAFEELITLNFEQRPEISRCFDTLEPKKILAAIELLYQTSIRPGKTLLFLDEIQECPRAILALRYFKEQMPELHVIGAGSLLEFVLNETDFRMPVGRVQFLFLKPLSLREYLEVAGHPKMCTYLQEIDFSETIEPVIHEELLKRTREYIALGGMPAIISTFLEEESFHQCQILQSALLSTYRNDFGKYARHSKHKYLQLLFEKAPGLIAQWFKYRKVDPHLQSREIKTALHLLEDAGLIHLVHATSASNIPLITNKNEKKFKLLFIDIGLVKRSTQLDLKFIIEKNVLLNNQGVLTEQFVGQELIAYSNPYEKSSLFFWVREKKSSSAEVDFVINVDSQIVPLEVKAGSTGRLRSMRLFMEEKKIPFGIRISQAPLSFENGILSIPFYLIREIPRLLRLL